MRTPTLALYHSADVAALGHAAENAAPISATVDTLIMTLHRIGARDVAHYLRTHVDYARRIRELGAPVSASAVPDKIVTVVTFDPMVRP